MMHLVTRVPIVALRATKQSASTITAILSLMLAACASTPAERPTTAAPNQPAAAPAASQGQKTIIVGQSFEMASLNRVGRNDAELDHVLNAGLVTRDTEKYQTLPWMPEAIPSLDNRTWVVNP